LVFIYGSFRLFFYTPPPPPPPRTCAHQYGNTAAHLRIWAGRMDEGLDTSLCYVDLSIGLHMSCAVNELSCAYDYLYDMAIMHYLDGGISIG
jgi:hypothetical protein